MSALPTDQGTPTTNHRLATLLRRLPSPCHRLFRRGRTPGLRTAKTVLAAVLSYVVAEHLHTSDAPILAPLTALLVVQLTMYDASRTAANASSAWSPACWSRWVRPRGRPDLVEPGRPSSRLR